MVKAKSDECEEDKFMLLPDELKLHIFSNLGRQDLQAVSATCRDFNRLSQDLSLWTELSVDISETRRTLIYEVAKYPWLKISKINSKTGIEHHTSCCLTCSKIKSLVRKFPFLKVELVGNWGIHEAGRRMPKVS